MKLKIFALISFILSCLDPAKSDDRLVEKILRDVQRQVDEQPRAVPANIPGHAHFINNEK